MHLTSFEAAMPFEAALGMIGFGAFLGGWIQDRTGPRVVALSGGALYAVGVMSASLARTADQFWILLTGYGVIGGLGVGIAYIVPGAMLQKHFPDRRGLVTGIAVAGFGLGGVLTTAVAAPILTQHAADPTAAFLPLGVLYLVMISLGGSRLCISHRPVTRSWSP
jgi:OFA family oxalate/formate antiporter-like MFS transporter